MPDRDKETQQARNKRTLLIARTPDGFPGRVKAEADARGMTVSAFVVAAIEPQLGQPDGGSTASAGDGERGTTARKPHTRPAPQPVTFKAAEPEGASDIVAALRRRRTGGQP